MKPHRRIQLTMVRQLERHHHDHYLKHHTSLAACARDHSPPPRSMGPDSHIVWADSRFRTGGKVNDIVITTRSTPLHELVCDYPCPIDATSSKIDHFIPA